MKILERHDYPGYVKRVVNNLALEKSMKYRPLLIPFLDAMCDEEFVSRESLIKTLGIEAHEHPEDVILTLLTNVTMPIQRPNGGNVWPINEGGWYESVERNLYRVNQGFAKAWRDR